MKLRAEIDGHQHEVEIDLEGDRLSAKIDGRPLNVEVSEPEPGVFLFKHANSITEAAVSGTPGEPYKVRAGKYIYEINIIDPKRLRGSASSGGSDHGSAEIRTAMPGKVVRIIAEVGAEVKKGDGIVVVEAMKMQNEIRSPRDATVRDIRVTTGSTVSAGDVLAVIE